jgi:hypothetical protein
MRIWCLRGSPRLGPARHDGKGCGADDALKAWRAFLRRAILALDLVARPWQRGVGQVSTETHSGSGTATCGSRLCNERGTMDQNTTALERAFQLAKSGDFATIEAIKSKLKAEGYPISQIVGKSLIKQLRDAARAANGDLTGARTAAVATMPKLVRLLTHWASPSSIRSSKRSTHWMPN